VLRRLSLRLQVYGVGVLMTGDPGNALPETAENRSSRQAAVRAAFVRLKPLWIGVLIVGLAGVILTIVADFATLRSVKVVTASCSDLAGDSRGACITHGHEEHSYALVLLGLAAGVMLWGAVAGRSRPAAAALALLGAAVLAIALVTDVPDIHKTGVIGERYDEASASAGIGLWLELAGGALLLLSGVIALTAPRPRARTRRRAVAG
jgi:formate-dependent nitrite reductase membrane component NrfD